MKLDILDSAGGHILCAFALILTGALFYVCGIPKAEDLIIFALGILGTSTRRANDGNGKPKPVEPPQA